MLITIEGIDGSGKSTLFSGLKTRLTDLNPIFTKEPGSALVNTSLRKEIAMNRDPIAEATLFVADHAAHLAEVVKPALDDHKLIISDRYVDSRFVYQSITLSGIIDDPYAWLERVHSGWSIKPDITFYLSIPPVEAMRRITTRDGKLEHFEQLEILERVSSKFMDRINSDPDRFIIIDATESPETILNTVETNIRKRM